MNQSLYRISAAVLALLLVVGMTEAAAQDNANVAGKWEMTMETQRGTSTSTLTFEQTGDKLKGTIVGQRGERPLTGTVSGKDITFTVTFETPDGQQRSIEYKATVDGDTMKGTVQMGPNAREWTAKRQK